MAQNPKDVEKAEVGFRSPPPPAYAETIDETKYIGCCGFHVIGNVKFFTWIEVVCSALALLGGLTIVATSAAVKTSQDLNLVAENSTLSTLNTVYTKSYEQYDSYKLFDYVFRFILSAAALYGIYKVKPLYFLPTLIYKIFGFIVGVIVVVGFGIAGIILAALNKEPAYLALLLISLLGAVFLLIGWYFLNIYWRAYKYLKEVKEYQERTKTVYPMGNLG